ncbi:murein L,D-transpeptidase family protein [Qipengyuania nanhaisediminis]|uniref:L,D-transpeptidase family protein n=1 Tax=Qipengyuania nanhaisediminis TaxID=604088 RepID=UPI0038B25F0D
MTRLFALALTILLSACAAPQGAPVATTGSDAAAAAPSAFPTGQEPRYATRSIPRDPLSNRPLVADYLVIDKSERLLVAYRDGRPVRAYRGLQFGDAPGGHKRFQGDERTPEGIYTIDRRNPQSRFHLSLGISYPNASDRAFAAQYGRSPGGDIFIHGQPTGRPGRMRGDWTDGCIALSNAEIEELWQIVPDGTPIEIRP